MKITKALQVVSPHYIPSGVYNGTRSAYQVEFRASNGEDYILYTDIGVRGLNLPCTVTVNDNEDRTIEVSD